MMYRPAERNRDGIQHEEIRKVLDPDFEVEHDKLSASYYDGGVYTAPDGTVYDFRDGKTSANKAILDKLHAVLTHEYNVGFDAYNRALSPKDQVKETAEKQAAAVESAVAVDALKSEGISIGVKAKRPVVEVEVG